MGQVFALRPTSSVTDPLLMGGGHVGRLSQRPEAQPVRVRVGGWKRGGR